MSESKRADKIYCANCEHCKVVRVQSDDNHYQKRVRCDAGHWRKKLGEEKIHKYFTVGRRSVEICKDYVAMGDPKPFMKELKKNLPLKDEEYPIEQGREYLLN